MRAPDEEKGTNVIEEKYLRDNRRKLSSNKTLIFIKSCSKTTKMKAPHRVMRDSDALKLAEWHYVTIVSFWVSFYFHLMEIGG